MQATQSVTLPAAKSTARRFSGKPIVYLILIVLAAVSLGPFIYSFLASFKTPDKVLDYPPSFFPQPWTWNNYKDIFSQGSDAPFARWLLNSFIYGSSICALNLLCSSMAAFALARMEFVGRAFWTIVTLAVMMVPGEINWISRYIILNHFGPFNLIDTYFAVILPLAVQPFSVFLITQFFKTLPKEVEEAAVVDGASRFRIYWQILLPMARPALVAAGILSFQGAWNAFTEPLLYLNSIDKFPITVGLTFWNGEYSAQPNLILAGAMFNTIPMVIIFFLFQRYFIQGAATSGLGGR
jgi:ABC-type glycerol-3-phosphate transport system permease component